MMLPAGDGILSRWNCASDTWLWFMTCLMTKTVDIWHEVLYGSKHLNVDNLMHTWSLRKVVFIARLECVQKGRAWQNTWIMNYPESSSKIQRNFNSWPSCNACRKILEKAPASKKIDHSHGYTATTASRFSYSLPISQWRSAWVPREWTNSFNVSFSMEPGKHHLIFVVLFSSAECQSVSALFGGLLNETIYHAPQEQNF